MTLYVFRTRANKVYRLTSREDGGWRVDRPLPAPVATFPGLQQALAELVHWVPWDSWSRRSRGLLAGLSGDKLP